jgi:HD superfamily phosphohydrolase
MSGTEYGSFDIDWLLNNIEIGKLTIGGDKDAAPFEVDGFILSHKGLQAAESYLLGRFHLYTQVYMHKATRAAEKMLESLLGRLAELISNNKIGDCGLPVSHSLSHFFSDSGETIENYLLLDDAVIWGSLPMLEIASDKLLAEIARRLRNRRLYKCFDVGALAETSGGDLVARFRKRLNDAKKESQVGARDALEDRVTVSAYKFREYESPDALSKIMIRRPDKSGQHEDVAKLSSVVRGLEERRIFRVYARSDDVYSELDKIWAEAKNLGGG